MEIENTYSKMHMEDKKTWNRQTEQSCKRISKLETFYWESIYMSRSFLKFVFTYLLFVLSANI